MRSKAFENEFIKNFELLTHEQQEKALAYVKELLLKNSNNKNILNFAGSIDHASIQEMSEAIDAGCENIDNHEW